MTLFPSYPEKYCILDFTLNTVIMFLPESAQDVIHQKLDLFTSCILCFHSKTFKMPMQKKCRDRAQLRNNAGRYALSFLPDRPI